MHPLKLCIPTTVVILAAAVPAVAQSTLLDGSVDRATSVDAELLPGVVRPWREVVQAAPFDGVLMKIAVSEGQFVTAGDVIAVMDNRTAKAAVAAAEAAANREGAMAHARMGRTLAQSRLARMTSSRAKGATPAVSIDEARTAFEQAKATLVMAVEQVTQAKRNLDLERTRLEQHSIRAPFDGRIVRVLAEEGAAMTTASPIVSLIAIDRLKAELHLPVRLYGTLEVGAVYILEASEPVGGSLQACLESVEPVIDPTTRTFRCRFAIENPDEQMPAGFTVYPSLEGLALARVAAYDE